MEDDLKMTVKNAPGHLYNSLSNALDKFIRLQKEQNNKYQLPEKMICPCCNKPMFHKKKYPNASRYITGGHVIDINEEYIYLTPICNECNSSQKTDSFEVSTFNLPVLQKIQIFLIQNKFSANVYIFSVFV